MTNMHETISEPTHPAIRELSETPGKEEVLRWLKRNRGSIERLLRKGDVIMQMDERATKANELPHQWVKVSRDFPHHVSSTSGERLHLASLGELDDSDSAVRFETAESA